MYNKHIRIYLVIGLIVSWGLVFGYGLVRNYQLRHRPVNSSIEDSKQSTSQLNEALRLLKQRKDRQAMQTFEMILLDEPENLNALWGKAEVLRRTRKFDASESILKGILEKNPKHAPSLISLAYIRYKYGNLKNAQELIEQALEIKGLDKENTAIAYLMQGTINSKRSRGGGILNKFFYGTQIKGYFLKAKNFAPDLSEVRLGLGTFYLLAPSFFGGNQKNALEELEEAVKLAPDFATANARLAQAYQKAGNLEKYDFYLQKAKKLDPENEVLEELR
ncbi:MAG: hypothetical protein PHY94_05525 [Candidatus Omnitrophica bacterium]|nr:hypothetical protein [Candidatus Omnitrophota bacterium]